MRIGLLLLSAPCSLGCGSKTCACAHGSAHVAASSCTPQACRRCHSQARCCRCGPTDPTPGYACGVAASAHHWASVHNHHQRSEAHRKQAHGDHVLQNLGICNETGRDAQAHCNSCKECEYVPVVSGPFGLLGVQGLPEGPSFLSGDSWRFRGFPWLPGASWD